MNIFTAPRSNLWSRLSPLLTPLMRGWTKPRLSLSDTVKQAGAIRQLIHEARVGSDASRLVLYGFHNGGVFLKNQPRWYLAVVNEALASNIGPAILGDDPILASRCIGFIDQFWDVEYAPDVPRCASSLSYQRKSEAELSTRDVASMEHGFVRVKRCQAVRLHNPTYRPMTDRPAAPTTTGHAGTEFNPTADTPDHADSFHLHPNHPPLEPLNS